MNSSHSSHWAAPSSELRLISQQGNCQNWGCNVDEFPRHDFHYPTIDTANEALRALVAGTDHWVQNTRLAHQCYRERNPQQ